MAKGSQVLLGGILAAVGVVAIGLRVGVFTESCRRIHVSGDESIAALQAVGLTQSRGSAEFQAKQHPRGIKGRFPLLFMAQPYLFPLESYLAAPYIRLLPANAVGARLPALLLGFLTTGLCVWFLLARRSLSDVWPGILLALIPSAYLLLHQGAYALPSYPSLLFFTALVLALTQVQPASPWRAAAMAALTGFCGGAAVSGSLLAVPLLAAAAVVVCPGRSWREALRATPAFVVGALAGLAPYLLAKRAYPGAHAAVSQAVPVVEAAKRIWSPALDFTLPAALGFGPPVVPDAMECVGPLSEKRLWVGAALWLAVMLVFTGWRVVLWFRRLRRDRWPTQEAADAVAALSWACLLLFVLSRRFGTHEFRYLAPLVLLFPPAIGLLYADLGRVGRLLLGCLAAALVVVNLAATRSVTAAWRAATFEGYFTDARPAIEYLRERGITRAYASYFDAYAVTYLSGEKILCAQPYNERFYGWPLPYKDAVDAATNVAYALGPSRRFQAVQFEKDLAFRGVTYRLETRGKFAIYTDFRASFPAETRIPGATLRCHASHGSARAAALADGNRLTRWNAGQPQAQGMWIEAGLPDAVLVSRVALAYDFYPHDQAAAVDVLVRRNGEWIAAKTNVVCSLDPFEFRNGHPVYGSQTESFRFDPPILADAVRIAIAEPRAGRDWTVGEIEIYCGVP